MRLGLLTTSFPRWAGDPAGCFVLGLCQALARAGHSVHVLAPEPQRPCPQPRWPGVELCWVPYLRPRGLQRLFYGAGVLNNLQASAAAWPGVATYPASLWAYAARRCAQWDAMISVWGLPSAMVAATLPRRPRHLAVLPSADVHLLRTLPGGGALAKLIAGGAEHLAFSSALHRAAIGTLLGAPFLAKSSVLPLGIDAPLPRALPREQLRRELGLEGFTLLSLGRLVPVKGLDVLLRALQGVGGVELIVAGDGPERAALQSLATRLGVAVRFVGTIAGASKARFLQAVDAFVLPSVALPGGRSEGLPTALMEAMSHALPVLASRVGGIPELVGQAGHLLPAGDVGAWRAALLQLRDDPRLCASLGRAAAAAAAPYTWPRLLPRYLAALGLSEQSLAPTRQGR